LGLASLIRSSISSNVRIYYAQKKLLNGDNEPEALLDIDTDELSGYWEIQELREYCEEISDAYFPERRKGAFPEDDSLIFDSSISNKDDILTRFSEDDQINIVQHLFSSVKSVECIFKRNLRVPGHEIDLLIVAPPKVLFIVECKRSGKKMNVARKQVIRTCNRLEQLFPSHRIIALVYSYYGFEFIGDVGPTRNISPFIHLLYKIRFYEQIRDVIWPVHGPVFLGSQSGLETNVEALNEPLSSEVEPEGKVDDFTLLRLEQSNKVVDSKALPPIARTSGPWAGMSVGAYSVFTKAELLNQKSVRR
jgi:hypothetical protein